MSDDAAIDAMNAHAETHAELLLMEAELNHMKEVLAWASENLVWCSRVYKGGWRMTTHYDGWGDYVATNTLYDALLSAYRQSRGEK